MLYDAEEGLFKAWYEICSKRMSAGGYAVSDDGIRWRRPELGIIPYRGSKANNLYYRGTYRRGPGHPICPNVIKRGPGDYHLYYWDALEPSGPARR